MNHLYIVGSGNALWEMSDAELAHATSVPHDIFDTESGGRMDDQELRERHADVEPGDEPYFCLACWDSFLEARE